MNNFAWLIATMLQCAHVQMVTHCNKMDSLVVSRYWMIILLLDLMPSTRKFIRYRRLALADQRDILEIGIQF